MMKCIVLIFPIKELYYINILSVTPHFCITEMHTTAYKPRIKKHKKSLDTKT
jgi:hypothetical protein